MENQHISEAKKWLCELRNGHSDYESYIEYVREEAREGNLSLADIGTSEEELAELRVKGCRVAASEWLNFLRNGTAQYDWLIGYVKEEAGKGNFSLADIGTSEEELAELRIKGCKTAASDSLKTLRKGSYEYEMCIEYVRKELSKCNLSLADIGTSEEELAQLRVKGCKVVARHHLAYLRKESDRGGYDISSYHVLEEARKGNFSLADLGTSKEELAELRVKGYKASARKWLGYLRNGAEYKDGVVWHLRNDARRGNFSLADIGTSEEELASLLHVSA